MKRIIYIYTLTLLFVSGALAQNEFYNDGAEVYVQAGGLIYVQGEVINDDQAGNVGRMFNSGDIQLEGNWTNTSTSNVFQANDPGTTTFLGTSAFQTIGGTNDTYFNNLTLNKPGGVLEVRQLRNSLCDQVLNLTNDFLNTQTFIFGVANPNPASITRVGATAPNVNNSTAEGYVTSTVGSTGRLSRTTSNLFAGATYFYPVGTATRFRPVSISPTSVGTNVYSVQFVDAPPANRGSRAVTLATINPNWYHFIERQVPLGSPEDIRIYWDFVSDDICDVANVTMSEYNGVLWDDLSPTASTNPGGAFLGYTTKSGYPGVYPTPWNTNQFALAGLFIAPSVSSCVFPVEMVALEAKALKKDIQLDWLTASESNNAGFEVHRSTDGNVFSYLGWVTGAGTTNQNTPYSFIDDEVIPNQVYYYQLHQRDYNGNISQSNIVSAIITEGADMFVGDLFPNPTENETALAVQVQSDVDCNVEIVNALGQVIMTKSYELPAGNHQLELPAGELATGTYFVNIHISGEHFLRKLVVQ